jgi:multidrug efflux pump
MTSSSLLGTTGITLQFDLNRNIDGAARDVQAAINAARSYLPANLPSNPTWRKVNPADSPIMIIALTSDIYTKGQMYDIASSVMQQRLSQVPASARWSSAAVPCRPCGWRSTRCNWSIAD